MKKALLIVFAAGFALLPASAKPLDLSKVSRNANWLMHMDFDAMRNSEIGSFILDAMENVPEAVERMEKMKKRYGVDVLDFSYLTMSGSGERHKGIAIMKGGVDTDKLVEFANSQDSVQMSYLGKNKVYSSSKGRHSMAFSAIKKNTIVGGPDADYVSEGIQLAKGKGASYKGHAILELITAQVENPGFVFFADVKGAAKNNELDPRAMHVLEKVKAGGMAVGDDDGSICFIAVMEATNEETCRQVEAMARGGMAMVDMRKATDKRLENFLEGHDVKREGKLLWVKMNFSVEAILDHLEKEMRKSA